jgi:hypothetical protein
MAIKVTYLFGAGASCGILPMVKDFPARLNSLGGYFDCVWAKPSNNSFPEGHNILESFSEVVKRFKKDIEWLSREASRHSSIDTLARKYYLLNKSFELSKLKILLNEFFIIEQLFRGIDSRYDSFFAAILKGDHGKVEVPDNINIISWNYDKQLEFSFGQFYPQLHPRSINHDHIVEEVLQVFPRNKSIPIVREKFSVVKLNGTFGGAIDDFDNYSQINYNVHIQRDLTEKQQLDILTMSLIRYYRNIDNAEITNAIKYNPTIYYSWEQNKHVTLLRESAVNSVSNTEILVVIGYSFPTFNRLVDKTIIKSMSKLSKVYIQNTPESVNGVIQRFKSISEFSGEVLPITSVDEFFIPFEFS